MASNRVRVVVASVAALLALGSLAPAAADFEVKAPDGRTLLIKDDGTWRVAGTPAAAASAATYSGPQAELQLTGTSESSGSCVLALTMVNRLPYEIGDIVPDFVVYRGDGVALGSQSTSFVAIKPGAQRQREIRFPDIRCSDIAKLKVERGDRCSMGELNRFSDANGQCLARVRLQGGGAVKFEK